MIVLSSYEFFVYNENMMKFLRYFLGVIIILSLLLGVIPVQAQDADSHFFNQTKHNVRGAFWSYYQGVKDAETVLGYPITEEFKNDEGVLIQYFQRARLEIQNGRVYITPLGSLTYKAGMQLNINNPMACQEYPTGFSVCFAFLDFFDGHGGLAFFGYPISPFEYQDDMIVQYFENGRLEWHPSNPNGQRVVTGNLGSAYFSIAGEDPARITGVKPLTAGITTEVLSLNVRAFPWKAVTYSTDQQLVFVVVQDQTLQPVPGATGEAKVKWTTGEINTLKILTGENGIATLSLPVNNQVYGGLVTVDVNVSHGSLTGHTTTSFRIWY